MSRARTERARGPLDRAGKEARLHTLVTLYEMLRRITEGAR